MGRMSLNKQFNLGLIVIATFTLMTIAIASHTAHELNKAYQRATSDFIPLMQISNELQSTAANLKSALFNIRVKSGNSDQTPSVENINFLWRKTQMTTEMLAKSHLIDDSEYTLLNQASLRINEYITHTRHLSLLLKQQAEIKQQLNEITPKVLTLLRKTETQLLLQLTKLNNRLRLSITNKEDSKKQQLIFIQITNYFTFYKQALLIAEKMVETQNSHHVMALNKLKRKVYLLGNKLEKSASNNSDKVSQKISLDWLDDAFNIYKGKHSIFNTQLSAIRTEVVIESLINQQVETAEQLQKNAKNIHLHIQDILKTESKIEQKEVVIKQYVLWAFALGAITMSILIAWQFIHKKIVKRVLNIRTVMLLLARGRTQIKIKQYNNDEFGDMEKALLKLQGYVKQVQNQAITDPLTQLHNRRSFDRTLKKEIELSQRNHQAITLFILDIDHFKQYNDYYGHPEGDAVIQEVATLLIRSCIRENDFIARVGGEEFAVILPNIDKDNAKIIAARIQENIEILKRPHHASLVNNYLTLSIGGKTITDGGEISPDDIYLMADQALYKAKEKRNDVVID